MEYKINKETILKYQMKDEFPEVFEVKIEVNNWYISTETGNKTLAFVKELLKNDFIGYGFDAFGDYYNLEGNWTSDLALWRKATPQEVEEALICEAKKRGFKNGSYKCLSLPKYTHKVKGVYFFDKENSRLLIGDTGNYNGNNNVVFYNGKWAEIIPTITKQQAEEKLKCKIID